MDCIVEDSDDAASHCCRSWELLVVLVVVAAAPVVVNDVVMPKSDVGIVAVLPKTNCVISIFCVASWTSR